MKDRKYTGLVSGLDEDRATHKPLAIAPLVPGWTVNCYFTRKISPSFL